MCVHIYKSACVSTKISETSHVNLHTCVNPCAHVWLGVSIWPCVYESTDICVHEKVSTHTRVRECLSTHVYERMPERACVRCVRCVSEI